MQSMKNLRTLWKNYRRTRNRSKKVESMFKSIKNRYSQSVSRIMSFLTKINNCKNQTISYETKSKKSSLKSKV